MPRQRRVVLPGRPHHITQRGNNRRDVFFEDTDRELYLSLLREYAAKYQVEILGYCLMTNHVHLIAVPADATGLAKAIGRVHNDYALASYSKTRIRAFVAESFLLLSSGGCLYLGGACLCGAKRSACWNGCAMRRMGWEQCPPPLRQPVTVSCLCPCWQYLSANGGCPRIALSRFTPQSTSPSLDSKNVV